MDIRRKPSVFESDGIIANDRWQRRSLTRQVSITEMPSCQNTHDAILRPGGFDQWDSRDRKEQGLVDTHTPLRLEKPLPLIPFVFHGASHAEPEPREPRSVEARDGSTVTPTSAGLHYRLSDHV
jgi:hypothetical protein